MRRRLVAFTALVWIAACTVSYAQSSIAGVVKDESGAVLPGVTVEASSPALIEKVRTAVTDGSGQYKIIDLRPGIYTVTFSLAGFNTVKREGFELQSNVTATVNGDLKVGALEETITVSGSAPMVDAQSAVQQSVMTRETLDAIPTGRNIFAVGALIAGTTTNKPDVGGSEGMQQTSLQVHGSESRDVAYHVDGMTINSNFGTGSAVGVYYNDGMIEEISYQTSALPAEVSQGGVRVNMVAKDGGNQFRGSVFTTAATAEMQSDNFSEGLRSRGLRAPNSIDRIYDLNFSLGGPIKRDKLWFFTTARRWGVNRFVANTFNPDGSQAIDDNRITSVVGRLTFQMNQKNKISGYYDKNMKYRGHRRDLSSDYQFIEARASYVQTTPLGYTSQARWQSTASDRLLLEAGISLFYLHYKTGYQPEVGPNDLAKIDFVRSLLSNAVVRDYDSYAERRTYSTAVSFVTGSHAFKTGVQLGNGPYRETYLINGDMHLRFRNGIPDSVDIFNTPVDVRESMDADLGIYAQDAWTINRTTINAGVRWDYFKASIVDQSAPAGRFVSARQFAPIENVPKWSNVVPRVALAHDLLGDGKHAIKVSASKYMQNEGVGLAHTVNPMFLSNDRRSWTDANGDGLAQLAELGPSTGFRGGRSSRIDPELRRPYNWEYVASVQTELLPRFSVSVAYFRRVITDLYGTKNQLVTSSDYTPVTITNPLTGVPLTIHNQNVATRARVDFLVSNYAELERKYSGVELKVDKRFRKGTNLSFGMTAGRKTGSIRGQNDDLNNPNVLINHTGYVDLDSTYQFKVTTVQPLPWGLFVSASLQSNTGLPVRRVLNVTSAVVPGGLTQVTQPVDLVQRGDVRLERMNLLDMRFMRRFQFGGSRRLELVGDLYNVLNSNVSTAEVETVGSALGRPVTILDGRLLRVGIKLNF